MAEKPQMTYSDGVHTDPPEPDGPGGRDSEPDWEGATPDTPTPDQPQSAQLRDDDVPDAIQVVDRTGGDEAQSGPAGQPA